MFPDTPPAQICLVDQNAPTTVDAARAARFDGDHDRARCGLERILTENPRDADAWVELGYLNAVTSREAAAVQAFNQALSIAPDYDDAKLGLAQLAYRSGDLPTARAWLERLSAERAADPELRAFRRAVAAASEAPVTWRWDVSAIYSTLTNDLPPWREAAFAVGRRQGRSSFGLGVEHAQRFGKSDTYGELRFARQFTTGVWGLAVGGTGNAHFRPDAAIRVEYATPEDLSVPLDGSLTIARYRAGQVDTLSLRARRNVTASLQLNARGILVRDETGELRSGYGAGATWQAERWLLDASWVDAPESSEGITLDVRAASFGVTRELTPNMRVRLGMLKEERDAFDRSEFAISFSRTF